MEKFEEKVAQYENMIYSIIRKLSIYKNQDEFFQIGLIALWEAHKGFNSNIGKFSSYAYSYIKGRMMTHLSKEKIIEEYQVLNQDSLSKISFCENKALDKELLLSYCDCLTEKQRKWVLLHFLYQFTIKEIADIEGVSASAVKGWRKEALLKIKEKILSEKK